MSIHERNEWIRRQSDLENEMRFYRNLDVSELLDVTLSTLKYFRWVLSLRGRERLGP